MFAYTHFYIHIFVFFVTHTLDWASVYQYTGRKERKNLAFLMSLVRLVSEQHPHSTPLYSMYSMSPTEVHATSITGLQQSNFLSVCQPERALLAA